MSIIKKVILLNHRDFLQILNYNYILEKTRGHRCSSSDKFG